MEAKLMENPQIDVHSVLLSGPLIVCGLWDRVWNEKLSGGHQDAELLPIAVATMFGLKLESVMIWPCVVEDEVCFRIRPSWVSEPTFKLRAPHRCTRAEARQIAENEVATYAMEQHKALKRHAALRAAIEANSDSEAAQQKAAPDAAAE